LNDVGLQADDFAFVQVGEAVAVGERLGRFEFEPVGADPSDRSQRQADEGRAVEGADVGLAAVGEIVGGAAMEGLVRVGREQQPAAAAGAAGQFGSAFQDCVEQQAVMAGDVLHVAEVLVAAFDLEAAHPGVDQRGEVVALVVVLDRQQMLFEGDHAALVVLQGVGQAAGLRAVAAVGAAAGLGVADVALPGKRDAQRAVDEVFDHDFGRHRSPHGGDFR